MLSRFDLIMVMLDVKDAERDKDVAQFILDFHGRGGRAVGHSGEAMNHEPHNQTMIWLLTPVFPFDSSLSFSC